MCYKLGMEMTVGEKKQLDSILLIMNNLKDYLNIKKINESENIREIYRYIVEIKNIQGNINNSISYISCLLAKEYLIRNLNLKNIDVSIKPQSANGLDIDEILDNGKRIIAEIKTIFPYGENDFGAAQKKSFMNDFKKLNDTNADYKYLFITEKKSFDIIMKKYNYYIQNINIVFL